VINLLYALLVAVAAPAAEPPPCAASLSTDPAACDSAIAAERDPGEKARLFYLRAYARNEKYRYDEAVRDLGEAVRLDPDYADAYHERAYTLGELSEFGPALEDSDREVALRPAHAPAYEERAFLRHRAGDLKGAFDDRARVVELRPAHADSMVARATAALWLGRFDDAVRDTQQGLRLAKAAKDEKGAAVAEKQLGRIAIWRRGSGNAEPEKSCRAARKKNELSAPGLAGDCTAAFFAARSPAEKADLLSIRALVWFVGHQDQDAAIADQVMAVALEPGNADWHANLGGSYVMVHHSWAGRRVLDRSLAIKESWPALAQRAAARHNLNDPEGAFADAKRSIELEPNEVAVTVLGDLAKDRGDLAAAKLYWMTAYRLGGRGDGIVERLKSIGVDRPEKEPKAQ
jgi:tetratricopeptide (TPR) repeat protein